MPRHLILSNAEEWKMQAPSRHASRRTLRALPDQTVSRRLTIGRVMASTSSITCRDMALRSISSSS